MLGEAAGRLSERLGSKPASVLSQGGLRSQSRVLRNAEETSGGEMSVEGESVLNPLLPHQSEASGID